MAFPTSRGTGSMNATAERRAAGERFSSRRRRRGRNVARRRGSPGARRRNRGARDHGGSRKPVATGGEGDRERRRGVDSATDGNRSAGARVEEIHPEANTMFFMIATLIAVLAGFLGYARTRKFVSSRLRYVDAAQNRMLPFIAGVGATLLAL